MNFSVSWVSFFSLVCCGCWWRPTLAYLRLGCGNRRAELVNRLATFSNSLGKLVSPGSRRETEARPSGTSAVRD